MKEIRVQVNFILNSYIRTFLNSYIRTFVHSYIGYILMVQYFATTYNK